MRIRKKDKTNVIRVGAFLTVLVTIMMIMIASIGKEHSIFDPKVEITARVGNVSNLKVGSYVELKGIRVGSVSSIQIVSPEKVEIKASILESQLKWIKQDSTVEINNAGLVGDKFLDIQAGSADAPKFNPEKDILQSVGEGGFKQIVAKGENIAATTETILLKIDGILTRLENGQKIADGVASMSSAAQNLEAITKELRGANMGTMAKSVTSSMQRLDRILGRVENGPGTANSLIYDDVLHDDLKALLGGAQRNKVLKYFIRESIKNSEKKK